MSAEARHEITCPTDTIPAAPFLRSLRLSLPQLQYCSTPGHRIFLVDRPNMSTFGDLYQQLLGFEDRALTSVLGQLDVVSFEQYATLCTNLFQKFRIVSPLLDSTTAGRVDSMREAVRPLWQTFREVIASDSKNHICYACEMLSGIFNGFLDDMSPLSEVWTEALGDIYWVWYTYAPDNPTFKGQARRWYLEAEKLLPREGRIQHALFRVEADPVAQLFRLAKGTISTFPYPLPDSAPRAIRDAVNNDVDNLAKGYLVGACLNLWSGRVPEAVSWMTDSFGLEYVRRRGTR